MKKLLIAAAVCCVVPMMASADSYPAATSQSMEPAAPQAGLAAPAPARITFEVRGPGAMTGFISDLNGRQLQNIQGTEYSGNKFLWSRNALNNKKFGWVPRAANAMPANNMPANNMLVIDPTRMIKSKASITMYLGNCVTKKNVQQVYIKSFEVQPAGAVAVTTQPVPGAARCKPM